MADEHQRSSQRRMVYVVLTSLGVLNTLILAFLQRYWSSVRRSVVLQVCFAFIAMSNAVVIAVYIVVFTSSVSLLRICMSEASQKLHQLVCRKRLRYVTLASAVKCVAAILTAFCCYTSVAAQKIIRIVGICKKLHCAAKRVSTIGKQLHCVTLPAAAKFVSSVITKFRYVTLASAAKYVTAILIAFCCYYHLTVFMCVMIGCTLGFYLMYCNIMKHRAGVNQTAVKEKVSADYKDPCQDWQMYTDRLETSLQRELSAISAGLSLDLSPDDLIDGNGRGILSNNGARHAEMKAYVVCNDGYAIDTAYVDGDGKHTWVRLPSRIASELRHDFLRRSFVSQSASGSDSVWALLSGSQCQRLLQDALSGSQTTIKDIVITRSVYGSRGYRDCKITFGIALEYRFVHNYGPFRVY